MTRILFVLTILFTLSACKDEPPAAQTETTPEGLAYTLIQLPGHDYIAIHVAWPTDWSYRPDTNKAAALIGTDLILAGGATGYPAGEVQERFADMDSEGVIYGAVNDHIIGELVFSPDHTSETIAIANAHLRAPTLDETWFTRLRNSIAQDMAEAQTQPAHAGFDAVRWAVFGTDPLRNALSLDDPSSFQTLTRDDIVTWHREVFTRNPSAIVVTGNIDPVAAAAAIDALFDGLPDADRVLSQETTANFAPREILLHMPDAEVTQLTFLAPLPPTREGGEIEDLILINALGGDDQSVLFNAVRTELRASYGFGAGMANYTRAHRIMFMTGEVETTKLADTARVVRDAYAAFVLTGPKGALDDRKAPFEADFAELPEYVVDLAQSELQSALDGYAPGRSLALTQELAAVTKDSLMHRLSNDFPAVEDFILIAVSPDADALPGACIITAPADAADCR